MIESGTVQTVQPVVNLEQSQPQQVYADQLYKMHEPADEFSSYMYNEEIHFMLKLNL